MANLMGMFAPHLARRNAEYREIALGAKRKIGFEFRDCQVAAHVLNPWEIKQLDTVDACCASFHTFAPCLRLNVHEPGWRRHADIALDASWIADCNRIR